MNSSLQQSPQCKARQGQEAITTPVMPQGQAACPSPSAASHFREHLALTETPVCLRGVSPERRATPQKKTTRFKQKSDYGHPQKQLAANGEAALNGFPSQLRWGGGRRDGTEREKKEGMDAGVIGRALASLSLCLSSGTGCQISRAWPTADRMSPCGEMMCLCGHRAAWKKCNIPVD